MSKKNVDAKKSLFYSDFFSRLAINPPNAQEVVIKMSQDRRERSSTVLQAVA